LRPRLSKSCLKFSAIQTKACRYANRFDLGCSGNGAKSRSKMWQTTHGRSPETWIGVEETFDIWRPEGPIGMKPTVYLDATIPSFYYEDRPGVIIRAWHELTVEFWDQARDGYDLFVSDETIRELQDPGYPEEKRDKCLTLVKDLPRLAMTPEVWDLASYYVREKAMPSDDLGDAFHLAFAT